MGGVGLVVEFHSGGSCLEADIILQRQAMPAAELKTSEGAYTNKSICLILIVLSDPKVLGHFFA